MSSTIWKLFVDGLTEPPVGGVSAQGWWIDLGNSQQRASFAWQPAAPKNTGNLSEWNAMGLGLKAVADLIASTGRRPVKLMIFGDSQLVINQLNGRWACRAAELDRRRVRCLEILNGLNVPWEAAWIPREENERADRLSRDGYRQATGRQAPMRRSA